VREITVERGMDPREFSLLAFGGAGPMLAPLLMREMGLGEVVVPRAPAAFSAWGMLMSDLEFDLAQTVLAVLDDATFDGLPARYAELESVAHEVLAEQGVDPDARVLEHRLDLRYLGQEHAISTPLEGAADAAEVRRRFEVAHAERYGHELDARVQILTLRLRAIGRVEKPSLEPLPAARPADALVGRREAYDFATRGLVDFGVYERSLLAPGQAVAGPAIVRDGTATLAVQSDQTAEVDAWGHLVIRAVWV
jgi:N-methylhydantoinase A